MFFIQSLQHPDIQEPLGSLRGPIRAEAAQQEGVYTREAVKLPSTIFSWRIWAFYW